MANKTPEQIQADYASKGGLAKVGIAADDLVRLAASGLTGGLLDRALGPDAQAATHASAVRAGLAGDVANVAGMAVGLKGAGAAIGGARNAARVLPAAVGVARAGAPMSALKLLTGTADAALVPAAKFSKTALAKGAGLLGLLGLSAAGRNTDTAVNTTPVVAPAPSAASAASTALAQGRQAPLVLTPRDQLDSYISQVLAHGATIGQVQRLGGLVEGTPKPVTHKDALIGTAGSIADATFAAARDAADKLPDAAAQDAARQKATDEYFKKYAALSGVNPQALSMQDLMDAQQGN